MINLPKQISIRKPYSPTVGLVKRLIMIRFKECLESVVYFAVVKPSPLVASFRKGLPLMRSE
jgi:hypothetical protein